ncbi:MAG: ABC transporter ATP-binding protein [Arenicella sp.]
MSNSVLKAINTTKRYGDFYANTNVNLDVKQGTIHGIIGPNGAGKTTLFNYLAGVVSLTSGQVLLEGAEIHKMAQHRRPSLGMGRSFQVTSLFPDLSVWENLRLAGQALKQKDGFVFWRPVANQGGTVDHLKQVISRLDLHNEQQTMVRALSHGQQRILEVGMALMAKPRVLLLDEPTSGMGIDDIPVMIKLLKSLKEECTVLLIEHNIHLVGQVCDTVTVLQGGEVIAEGTPEEVSANELVKTAYLGEAI